MSGSVEFQVFLASLMTNKERGAALMARAGVAADAPPRIRSEQEAAGFRAAPSLDYFSERLPRAGVEDRPHVALAALDPGTRRHRYTLSLWPGFDLGVLCDPAGRALYPHFVRTGPEAFTSQATPSLADLQPWSATIEEVLAAFGPPETDDGWDLARWLTYGRADERRRLTFDLGLLQEVSTVFS